MIRSICHRSCLSFTYICRGVACLIVVASVQDVHLFTYSRTMSLVIPIYVSDIRVCVSFGLKCATLWYSAHTWSILSISYDPIYCFLFCNRILIIYSPVFDQHIFVFPFRDPFLIPLPAGRGPVPEQILQKKIIKMLILYVFSSAHFCRGVKIIFEWFV